MSEPVQPSAAPALDVEKMLQLMIGCKNPPPCPYCINTAKAINVEIARLRALKETPEQEKAHASEQSADRVQGAISAYQMPRDVSAVARLGRTQAEDASADSVSIVRPVGDLGAQAVDLETPIQVMYGDRTAREHAILEAHRWQLEHLDPSPSEAYLVIRDLLGLLPYEEVVSAVAKGSPLQPPGESQT